MANLDIYRVNATPVTGGFLAHNTLDPVGRAFLAADIYAGAKLPVDLMMTQSAVLARVNITYAWQAHKRQVERAAIEAGLVPLVPPRLVVPKTNGKALVVVPSGTSEIDDITVVNFVRRVGADRIMAALDRWTRPQFQFAAE